MATNQRKEHVEDSISVEIVGNDYNSIVSCMKYSLLHKIWNEKESDNCNRYDSANCRYYDRYWQCNEFSG